MSYKIGSDGEVEFICQGKGCGKKVVSRSLRALPKGWLISGVLYSRDDDDESDYTTIVSDMERSIIPVIQGHWCSKKCAKSVLCAPETMAKIEEAGVCVVLFGKAELIVYGTSQRNRR